PLARLVGLEGRRHQPGGVALATRVGDTAEYFGNREYREGDSPRHMDWRATARLDRPVVREFREEFFQRVGVLLDTALPAPSAGEASPGLFRRPPPPRPEGPAELEAAVSLSAAVCDCLGQQECLVELFATGGTLYHLTTGRGLGSLDQVLELLACVEPGSGSPFPDLEVALRPHLPFLTAVVCILLDWDTERRAFLDQLRQEGLTVKCLFVRDTPPTLDPAVEPGWGAEIQWVTSAAVAGGLEVL
ncbi:MAG: DUF58 domain-containing protein, partial [Armatimonadetes bacterium]|nr:DUF58 domain-containing protein [Armatimonadota bacterium]